MFHRHFSKTYVKKPANEMPAVRKADKTPTFREIGKMAAVQEEAGDRRKNEGPKDREEE